MGKGKTGFDLIAIEVGLFIFGPLLLARLWATKRLMTGPPSGGGYATAKVVKAATA